MTALRFDESEGMQIAVGTSGGLVCLSFKLVIDIFLSAVPSFSKVCHKRLFVFTL